MSATVRTCLCPVSLTSSLDGVCPHAGLEAYIAGSWLREWLGAPLDLQDAFRSLPEYSARPPRGSCAAPAARVRSRMTYMVSQNSHAGTARSGVHFEAACVCRAKATATSDW